MKHNYAGVVFVILFVMVVIIVLKSNSRVVKIPQDITTNANLSLITEPDDGIAPVLYLIERASKSVDLVMYELEDKRIETALMAAERRGVAVRVLLSAGYQGQSFSQNEAAYDLLRANGVPVRWTQNYFTLTHEKSLVIDGSRALIMTFNLTSQYYSTSRDFGVFDTDARDVSAIEATFNNDWQGNDVRANNGDDLVWSPGSEPTMIALINSAKHSLDIYNEEMADMNIVQALINAAERGVVVNIDMTNSSEWKYEFAELTTAGANVRTYDEDASLYIHAKMILIDDSRVFVGSENFSANSLDDNRELGLVISDSKIITSLVKTFNNDWKGATLFSL